MKSVFYSIAAAGLLAMPVTAAEHAMGDASAGEDAFSQCSACHVVVNDEGETLAGRNGRQGPNLYGVIGRQAGSVEDFRYGDSIVEAGENGLVWDQESLAAYLLDPTGYLREVLDDDRARGKMSYRVRSEEDAANLAAFLATFSEAEEEGEASSDS
ncbi:cytochrome C [Maribius pontilimi]|uniref:Cytochrome C n=1 Tax=Palleronia pontilimi TaxID=1964209 RepID=A0A934IHX9_9RHOB|nr:cytochrome C [Palleronia pontilimi]MBJ3763196.1 cytochrome C [Palleronia pontilimi]